jgi:hypothetical protein
VHVADEADTGELLYDTAGIVRGVVVDDDHFKPGGVERLPHECIECTT